jgi:hypothetical protein
MWCFGDPVILETGDEIPTTALLMRRDSEKCFDASTYGQQKSITPKLQACRQIQIKYSLASPLFFQTYHWTNFTDQPLNLTRADVYFEAIDFRLPHFPSTYWKETTEKYLYIRPHKAFNIELAFQQVSGTSVIRGYHFFLTWTMFYFYT